MNYRGVGWAGKGEKTFVERIVGDSSDYHFISHNGTQNRARKELLWDIFTFQGYIHIYTTLSVIQNK